MAHSESMAQREYWTAQRWILNWFNQSLKDSALCEICSKLSAGTECFLSNKLLHVSHDEILIRTENDSGRDNQLRG